MQKPGLAATQRLSAQRTGWTTPFLPLSRSGMMHEMTFCPRCQGPIPNDAERPTGNTVYCPHCDALLVRSGDEWVEIEPTP